MRDLESVRYSEITVQGDDRLSYLQGQLTQDLTVASQGMSLLLAPSGEVLTDIAYTIRSESIQLVVPSDLLDGALARLRRFVLRTKVDFELVGETTPPIAFDQMIARVWPSAAEWDLALPPHSFGRGVVDSTISFTKGCFTGQELVGRADARGATMPWRFVAGRGGETGAVGEWLSSAGPDGPKGLTSGLVVDGVLAWRGIAHRTLDPADAAELGTELVFMA